MATVRAVYIKVSVNRLTNKDKVITASEHFEDDRALALPSHIFRYCAEGVTEKIITPQFIPTRLWRPCASVVTMNTKTRHAPISNSVMGGMVIRVSAGS